MKTLDRYTVMYHILWVRPWESTEVWGAAKPPNCQRILSHNCPLFPDLKTLEVYSILGTWKCILSCIMSYRSHLRRNSVGGSGGRNFPGKQGMFRGREAPQWGGGWGTFTGGAPRFWRLPLTVGGRAAPQTLLLSQGASPPHTPHPEMRRT